MSVSPPLFQFDNTYARELEGFYVAWQGAKVPSPKLLLLNRKLADDLGLDPDALDTPEGAAVFAGVNAPDGASPLAQVYAGHQFGGFSPQLGDGRALLIGEVIDKNGQRRDIQLKGSGPTPFSRGGDGKAVLGPVLREYIIGEAMHALGVPTTRALAAVSTGETIFRDGPKPGAVLTRVASSHLRVGTFQFFAARSETEKLRQLADYAIQRHDPDLADAPDKYLRLYRRVVERQAALVANWILVGFIHGVMNTDNTTISGETIDYGPCAFMDAYDPATVFSSIDVGGRYAFARQPQMAQWNLARFGESLLALIDPDDIDNGVALVSAELSRFPEIYNNHWRAGMRRKLGLSHERNDDQEFFEALLTVMQAQKADYTLTFRHLGEAASGAIDKVRNLLIDPTALDTWLSIWRSRLESEADDAGEIKVRMDSVNPLYIPRNHKVEEALQAAETGEMGPTLRLLEVLADPFTERAGLQDYATPAPEDFGSYQTFCGT